MEGTVAKTAKTAWGNPAGRQGEPEALALNRMRTWPCARWRDRVRGAQTICQLTGKTGVPCLPNASPALLPPPVDMLRVGHFDILIKVAVPPLPSSTWYIVLRAWRLLLLWTPGHQDIWDIWTSSVTSHPATCLSCLLPVAPETQLDSLKRLSTCILELMSGWKYSASVMQWSV